MPRDLLSGDQRIAVLECSGVSQRWLRIKNGLFGVQNPRIESALKNRNSFGAGPGSRRTMTIFRLSACHVDALIFLKMSVGVLVPSLTAQATHSPDTGATYRNEGWGGGWRSPRPRAMVGPCGETPHTPLWVYSRTKGLRGKIQGLAGQISLKNSEASAQGRVSPSRTS